jgi:hypothetical protein
MTSRSIRLASAAFALAWCASIPSPAASTTPAPTTTSSVTTKETALQRIQRSVARIDKEASTPEGEARVVARLSAQLATPEDTLRARREGWALSWGEVAMVYGFARSAKKQSATLPDEIVEMRRSGMAWDAIGKKIGVNVDTVAARVNRSVPPKPAPAPTPH